MKHSDEAEVSAWFRRYRASRDRAVRERIVHHHRWIAERCARRFADRGEPLQDLEQVAQIGIVKALERFDPDRGPGFPAFAMPTVMGELRRHFRDTTWSVSVPRRAKDLSAAVSSTTADLTQSLGRSPRVEEVAEAMALPPDTVLETIAAAGCYRTGSLDDPDAAGLPGTEGIALRDRIGDDDVAIDHADLRVTMLDAICRLDERSQRIVVWRYYDGLTQREIGELLGVGQVQVSRLLRAALASLRPHLEPSEPGGTSDPPPSGGRHGPQPSWSEIRPQVRSIL